MESFRKSGWRDGGYEFYLKLKVDGDSIKSITFLDEDGTDLNLSSHFRSQSNEFARRKFTSKGELPPRVRVVVELYTDVQTYGIPFKLENISLLGRSPEP